MASHLREDDAFAKSDVRGRSPEKRLLAAVLMEALQEFEHVVHMPNDPRRQELWAWFFGRDAAWPFSFENLCDQLDLNPSCIRTRIAALATRRRRRHTPPTAAQLRT